MTRASRGLCELTRWKSTAGTAGETDVDVSEADYTTLILLLTIANGSTSSFIDDCYVHFDLDQTTAGFGDGYTSETIQFAVARAIDGSNVKIDANAAGGFMSPTVTGDVATVTRAMSIHVGPIGPAEDAYIYVTVSAEQADFALPYVVYYRGPKPTITEVAAV